VENKVDRLVVLCVGLLLHVLLVLLEQLRAELDVAWFVYSMDLYAVSVSYAVIYWVSYVAKACRNTWIC
jgi:hypothetical protein